MKNLQSILYYLEKAEGNIKLQKNCNWDYVKTTSYQRSKCDNILKGRLLQIYEIMDFVKNLIENERKNQNES